MPTHQPSVLSTYLGKIARQLSIDVFRKRNSVKRYASEYAISLEELGDTFSDGTTPEQALDAKLLDEAINSFLRTLSDDASCRLPVFDSGICYSNCISPACRVAQ